jgi:hypothetical protein
VDDHTEKFELRFEGLSPDKAGPKAMDLRLELLDVSPDISVSIVKDDATNQDLGATIVLILGTPAIIAVANGIAAYLKRDRAKISIYKDGSVIAVDVSGNDAARIAEALGSMRKK